jgi:hypothetical protein
MPIQNLRKSPNLVKRVVKWSRRDTNDVRFAEIAFHVGGVEFLEQSFWMF